MCAPGTRLLAGLDPEMYATAADVACLPSALALEVEAATGSGPWALVLDRRLTLARALGATGGVLPPLPGDPPPGPALPRATHDNGAPSLGTLLTVAAVAATTAVATVVAAVVTTRALRARQRQV
jgi:hypothetical protein